MFWRVASKARSARVQIEGSYHGCTAFLVGGSPRLRELDLRLLRLPGAWSMAINNAAVMFEPQAFIALDAAGCFNPNIFNNPRVLKLFNYNRWSDLVSGKRLCHYPNTLFFDMKDETQMMMSEFCQLEGPLAFWSSTFFTGLAALYQLGFRRVNLLGCTFDTKGYAHGRDADEYDQARNLDFMGSVVKTFRELLPMLEDEGMAVRTCHENSALADFCPYVSYHDALSECAVAATSVEYNDPRSSFDAKK